MSHSQTKELNKIPLGSMDFFIIPWVGTIPADTELEVEENMIGRTKNGATINYSTEWYTATSDDGKAKKRKLVGETATISYGNITWNSRTLERTIATARTTSTGGKRTTKIGGVANDNGIRYLIRGLYKDKVDGDIRITGVGVNTGGWESAFAPNSETIITPQFELEPCDNEGTLLIYEEEVIEEYPSISMTNSTASVAVDSTVTVTANVSPSDATINWTSSDTTIATLSAGTTGNSITVTGASAGTSTITGTITYNAKTYSATCTVTVTAS